MPGYFALRLFEARQRAGLSQLELGELCGIARPNVSRLESGRHPVSEATLEQVAEGLGISMGELCSEAESPPSSGATFNNQLSNTEKNTRQRDR